MNDEAKGYEFVRINIYPDKVKEFMLDKDSELCDEDLFGFHHFTDDHSDDIDTSEQIEIASFNQEPDLDENWYESNNGEKWLKNIMNDVHENLKNIDIEMEKTTDINLKEIRTQALKENYADAKKGGETANFSEWVELSSESDPNFFRWLTGEENLQDFECPEWFDFNAFLQEFK
jgi:hypothetical protein